MIFIGEKDTDAANSTVICCLYSQLKAMLNTDVILFSSKFPEPPEFSPPPRYIKKLEAQLFWLKQKQGAGGRAVWPLPHIVFLPKPRTGGPCEEPARGLLGRQFANHS